MSKDLNALLHNTSPITADDPRYRSLLGDLQCNILSSHKKQFARFYFLRFRSTQDGSGQLKAKYLVGMLPRNGLERATVVGTFRDASALLPGALQAALGVRNGNGAKPLFASPEQFAKLKDLRIGSELEMRQGRKRTRGGTFAINFLLSRRGYEKLDAQLPDAAFNEGMAARGGKRFNDPPVYDWEHPYHEADALLIVAYDSAQGAEAEHQRASLDALKAFLTEHTEVLAEEEASSLRNKAGQQIEPFGFVDGISQPRFYPRPREIRATAWDDFAPLATTLVPDPHGRTPHACGTYFVFRKLEQDINEFHAQVETIAKKLKRPFGEVLAEFIGRRPDGAPLVGSREGTDNDFDYQDDQNAVRCPAHAHVRKVNPRGDIKAMYNPNAHRIVRRGLSYGPEIKRQDGMPVRSDGRITPKNGKDVNGKIGTLFLCAQASIENQFEYLQEHWANNPNHSSRHVPGVDPVAGCPGRGQAVRIAFHNVDRQPTFVDFASCVRMRGGGYFFAPSISYLKGLLDDIWI